MLFFYHWHVTGEAGVGWPAQEFPDFPDLPDFPDFPEFPGFPDIRIFRNFRAFRSFRIFRGNHEPLHAVNQPLWQSGRSHEHDHVNRQVSDFADALQFSPYFSFKHPFSPLSGEVYHFIGNSVTPKDPFYDNSASRKRGIFDKSLTSQCLTSSLTSQCLTSQCLTSIVYRLTSPLYHHRALVPPLAKREPARGRETLDVRREWGRRET